MLAIQVSGERLVWTEVAAPKCGVGEIRVKVAATALNRADLLQRKGGYPPPPVASDILGLECSGEVVEVGEGVTRCAVGDLVCALLAGGGYAEEVVVPAGQALKIPQGMDLVAAAALPEVFATAYLNLYREGQLQGNEKVVIHAGASGVGTAAIQLLSVSNNPCFVTVGSADKLASCVQLGAAAGALRQDGSFAAAVREWSGDGVDVILDPVGGRYLADNLDVLKLGGRLVLIGLMGGASAETSLAQLMMKRARIIGSTLRARSIAEKASVMDGLKADVWPHLETQRIVPVIETQFPIEQAEAAHELLAGNATTGKILLTV